MSVGAFLKCSNCSGLRVKKKGKHFINSTFEQFLIVTNLNGHTVHTKSGLKEGLMCQSVAWGQWTVWSILCNWQLLIQKINPESGLFSKNSLQLENLFKEIKKSKILLLLFSFIFVLSLLCSTECGLMGEQLLQNVLQYCSLQLAGWINTYSVHSLVCNRVSRRVVVCCICISVRLN